MRQIIAKDLGSSQVLTFSVATAYFLAQTVFQLVFSHMSHALGHKHAYLSGVTFYNIGAIIAVTSTCGRQLVAARTLQGVGAAGMLTMSAIVVVEMMPPRKRAAYATFSQAFGALGNICGPLFAAVLFKKFTWVSFCLGPQLCSMDVLLSRPLVAHSVAMLDILSSLADPNFSARSSSCNSSSLGRF